MLFHDVSYQTKHSHTHRFLKREEGLTENECEYFEERAAIMEYDGGVGREEAENNAYLELLQKRRQYLEAS